jgi:hypothetical protein
MAGRMAGWRVEEKFKFQKPKFKEISNFNPQAGSAGEIQANPT